LSWVAQQSKSTIETSKAKCKPPYNNDHLLITKIISSASKQLLCHSCAETCLGFRA
jgi:hypothetical protein